jgi:hypothetical protein
MKSPTNGISKNLRETHSFKKKIVKKWLKACLLQGGAASERVIHSESLEELSVT